MYQLNRIFQLLAVTLLFQVANAAAERVKLQGGSGKIGRVINLPAGIYSIKASINKTPKGEESISMKLKGKQGQSPLSFDFFRGSYSKRSRRSVYPDYLLGGKYKFSVDSQNINWDFEIHKVKVVRGIENQILPKVTEKLPDGYYHGNIAVTSCETDIKDLGYSLCDNDGHSEHRIIIGKEGKSPSVYLDYYGNIILTSFSGTEIKGSIENRLGLSSRYVDEVFCNEIYEVEIKDINFGDAYLKVAWHLSCPDGRSLTQLEEGLISRL